MRHNFFIGALLLILIHLFLLVHLRFTVWPEMLLMPYLINRGFELYRDMIVPWTPGLMWILDGWFWLVGLSPNGLKLLTWILIAVIDVFIFRIASKRYGIRSGLLALTLFLFLQPIYDGNSLWFDLVVVPLLLLAFYKQNLLFLGPAFLIKQSVIWLLPLGFFEKDRILPKLKDLILGLLLAFGLSSLWFWSRGTLSDYWYWAYDFAFRIFPTMPGHANLATWRHWAFALFPFVLMFFIKTLKARSIRWIVESRDPAAWSFFLLPFSLPRFGLFHFQPSVAFLVLSISAYFFDGSLRHHDAWTRLAGAPSKRTKPTGVGSILLGLLFIFLIFAWFRLLSHSWHRPNRFLEPDVYQFAAGVALDTNPDEPVLLVNGPELAYALADRLPPKPWFTQFPWFLELPGFQERVIESFKQQSLTQVIFTPYLDEGKYVPGSYQPKKLLEYVDSLSNDSND